MKNLTLRCGAALACALGLAACGGGSGNLLLAGEVRGLTKPGLVLQNGSDEVVVPANASGFAFATLLESDTEFDVQIKTQPTAATCTISNGKGKTGAYNVTSVIVTCATFVHEVGGTVSGLTGAGLVVNNGKETQEIAPGATSFKMTKFKADGSYLSGRVADGAPYGITVLQQPAGQTCTVSNGTGTMGAADVLNIAIACQ